MNTLYWITTLDSIIGVCIFLLIVTFVLVVIGSGLYFERLTDERKKYGAILLRITVPSFIFFLLAIVLTPSTDNAYIIYGVGETIDYLKDNKDAKKLPDKTIKALNAFLDNEIKKDSIKTNN